MRAQESNDPRFRRRVANLCIHLVNKAAGTPGALKGRKDTRILGAESILLAFVNQKQ